jgi:nitroreductase
MRKYIVIFLTIAISIPSVSIGIAHNSDDILLPPPTDTTMILEETIWRRSSIRNFTEEIVTDEDLSTILWAAYGLRIDGSRTVPSLYNVYAANLYVIRPEAVYKYDPLNHTLCFYKEGDYRFIGQYTAPLLIGIVWNKNILADGNLAAVQIGMIGQNIQLMSNALNLGSVINGDFPPIYSLKRIGLPDNEVPRIIIPLGHLEYPYNFKYLPIWISLLPKVQKSSFSLTVALEKRNETSISNNNLTRAEQIQILWSSYGYSYLVDKSDFEFTYHISRHRTVPSAHGYYPLNIYVVTSSKISEYIPNIYDPIYGKLKLIYILPKFPFPVFTYLKTIHKGDFRTKIADATSNPEIVSFPLLIIIVLNLNLARTFSEENWWWLWYYEAGSAAHNMLLESAAWNLSTNVIHNLDIPVIRSNLGLNESYIPMIIVPVGKP